MKKKVIGILGGMGPEATVNLFQKIIQYTPATKDQEHIPLLIDNNVLIPDRTAYILNKGENPLIQLIHSAKRLEKTGAECIVMPCNTAHYFYDEIKKHLNIPFINMIEVAAQHLLKDYGGGITVALLATLGTYEGKIYDNVFNSNAINILPLKEDYKKQILDIIYQVKQSNKEHKQNTMLEILQYCKGKGCSIIVLGCTELPMYFTKLKENEGFEKLNLEIVDPLGLLAKKVVQYSLQGYLD